MLNAERDADDGDEAGQRRGDVADGQPDPDQHEPDDVANQPHGAGAHVAQPRHGLAVDCLLAKREEGEGADDEAGASPGDADEGDETEQSGQPPGQPHEDASQYEPEQIEQEAEKGHVGDSRLSRWLPP